MNELHIVATPTTTVTWAVVPEGANHRVRIWDVFGDQDLFSRYAGNGTAGCMTIPAGAFVPGRRSSVPIEAFDNVNELGSTPTPCTNGASNTRRQ